MQFMRALFIVVVIAISMLPTYDARACSMFTIVNGDRVLMGNNEDFIKPGYIWFVPGTKKRYGRVNVGFGDMFAQGSMNEKGLCFDAAALAKVPYTPDKNKKTPTNLIDKIMNECATVDETIDYFEQYNCKHLAKAQFMFADRSGASAVIAWDPSDRISITRRDSGYLLITNDRLEMSEYRDPRFVLADRILSHAAEANVETAREALKSMHQRGSGAFTSYSTIYDLKAGTVLVYNLANFDEAVELNLEAELAKGKRSMPMEDLFEHSPSLASIRDDERVEYDTRIELDESQLDRFAGNYLFESDGQRFPMSIVVQGMDLALKRDGKPDAIMYPEGENLFRLVDGGQATFESDAEGNVTAMVLHSNGDHRVPREH